MRQAVERGIRWRQQEEMVRHVCRDRESIGIGTRARSDGPRPRVLVPWVSHTCQIGTGSWPSVDAAMDLRSEISVPRRRHTGSGRWTQSLTAYDDMATKRSLLSLSPLLASPKSFSTFSVHMAWLSPRFCASTPRHTTPSLRSFHQPARLVQALSPAFTKESVWQFVSNKVSRATHRDGHYGGSGGRSGYGGSGGSRGPWQRFRAGIDAIPNKVIFWGIMGLNGLVFASWNFAWMKYVGLHALCVLSFN